MTLAWYGHLKLQQTGFFTNATPLIFVILLSWGIAFFEYCLQVPANRMGFEGNGGSFSLMQLKVIQEVITLVVFVIFSAIAFHMPLRWNHFVACLLLIAAVYFVFSHFYSKMNYEQAVTESDPAAFLANLEALEEEAT